MSGWQSGYNLALDNERHFIVQSGSRLEADMSLVIFSHSAQNGFYYAENNAVVPNLFFPVS